MIWGTDKNLISLMSEYNIKGQQPNKHLSPKLITRRHLFQAASAC